MFSGFAFMRTSAVGMGMLMLLIQRPTSLLHLAFCCCSCRIALLNTYHYLLSAFTRPPS